MARFQRAGDAEAFNEVVERSLPRALGVARALLGDASLAEDAVQEAFLRVVRRRDAYVPGRPFGSWFFAILRNVCADARRARARQARLVREVAALPRAAPGRADRDVSTPSLLARLPKGEREVLTLRVVQELSFREVAAAMGISEEAAKKRAQRGLRRLRRSRHVGKSRGAAVVEAALPS